MNDDLLARIRTGDQLDAKVFPPMRWAVPGLIPEGFGLFTGPPKAGKSWAVLDIALAVACGGRALGKIATGEPRPVLYLALEDGERRLQERSRHLLADGVAIPANLHYVIEATPFEVLAMIESWLDRHGHTAPLVILDTLGKIMPPALPGEGAYQRDYRVGSTLKRLVAAHPGASMPVVHHTRKAGADDWMDSTSGTNGLNGAADFTVNLSRSRGETAGLIRVTGRDITREGEYAVTMTAGRWTLDGAELAEAAQRAAHLKVVAGVGDRSVEIIEYVTEQDEPVSAKQVEDALGITGARTYLARLVEAGRLTKPARGLYTPPVATVAVLHPTGDQAHERNNATLATGGTGVTNGVACRLHGTDYVPDDCHTCEQIGSPR